MYTHCFWTENKSSKTKHRLEKYANQTTFKGPIHGLHMRYISN